MKLVLLQRLPLKVLCVCITKAGDARALHLRLSTCGQHLTSRLTHPEDGHAGQGPRTCRQPPRSESGIQHVLLHDPNRSVPQFPHFQNWDDGSRGGEHRQSARRVPGRSERGPSLPSGGVADPAPEPARPWDARDPPRTRGPRGPLPFTHPLHAVPPAAASRVLR